MASHITKSHPKFQEPLLTRHIRIQVRYWGNEPDDYFKYYKWIDSQKELHELIHFNFIQDTKKQVLSVDCYNYGVTSEYTADEWLTKPQHFRYDFGCFPEPTKKTNIEFSQSLNDFYDSEILTD